MKPIEEQLVELNFTDDAQVIGFYEMNQLYFDNYEHISDKLKIQQFIDVKLAYADCLFNKKHFDKVIKLLDDVNQLLDRLDNDLDFHKSADRDARFLRAMVYSNQRKFKLSYPMFDRLVKEDPEHYYYKLWFTDAQVGRLNWFFNAVYLLGLSFILGDIFFSLGDTFSVDFYLLGLGIVGVTYLARRGLTLYFEKKKKNYLQHQL
jgi:tetratricopeptide (TPR) repeat protein